MLVNVSLHLVVLSLTRPTTVLISKANQPFYLLHVLPTRTFLSSTHPFVRRRLQSSFHSPGTQTGTSSWHVSCAPLSEPSSLGIGMRRRCAVEASEFVLPTAQKSCSGLSDVLTLVFPSEFLSVSSGILSELLVWL
ncbi:hypothetical protein BV22DRAFT_19299 [Leucogyrophana mollusca]|uniref:Uncharacterized protein n=1 Tax=Leucogyrophana mollusca TaxID=85980 RepID=A0ACB8C155_9AGAM|nr:hypothetical protein BV22DRAFT_19299 [Leucogyrophana mollusca]